MDKKDKILIAATGLVAGAGTTIAALGEKLFRATVVVAEEWTYGGKSKSNKKKSGKKSNAAVPLAKYGDRVKQEKEWLKAQPFENAWISSSVDDVKLHGEYLPVPDAKRIVLCVHGYRGSSFNSFSGVARYLHEDGSELLLVDQRGCGASEGKYVTFGAREKYDVLDWLDYIDSRNPKGLPVYLYGVSMGATSVMCASQYSLPGNCVGMIADCGFTTMKEICSECIRKWYHISPHPLIEMVDLNCQKTAGFRMKDADAVEALRHCTLPSLFIHGTADDFVPPAHAVRNYQACASEEKDILWVEDAEHACSYYEDSTAYESAIQELFAKCEVKEA